MSKKATKKDDAHSYPVGQAVLGKMRGYPPWPGMVVDPDTVPSNVLKERPTGKKSAFNCIIFFPVGEYAWLSSKDISALKPHEINAFLTTNPVNAESNKKTKNDLREGYRIALDPHPWLEELKKKQAEAREREENAEVDQLQSDEEDAGGDDDDAAADPDAEAEDDDAEGDADDGAATKSKKKAVPKKRKRESDAAGAKRGAGGAGRAKKESGAGEGSTRKRKSTSGADGASAAPASGRGRGGAKKSKAVLESEDDADHDPVPDGENMDGPLSAKASPPPAKKLKRDKEEDAEDSQSSRVREWRHKLQKVFLSKAAPKPDDLVPIDQLFRTVEQYEGMTIDQLSFSKIGKVMRHIAALGPDKIPQESEEKFKFRTRAKTLVDKWHLILNANKEGGGSGKDKGGTASPAPPASAPIANGTPTKASDAMDVKEDASKTNSAEPQASKGDEELTQGTKNLDLNGTAPTDSMKVETAAAESTTNADVPMAEA